MNNIQVIPSLPPEMWQRVFTYLPRKDVGSANAVCRQWHALINDRRFWVEWLKRDASSKPKGVSAETWVNVLQPPPCPILGKDLELYSSLSDAQAYRVDRLNQIALETIGLGLLSLIMTLSGLSAHRILSRILPMRFQVSLVMFPTRGAACIGAMCLALNYKHYNTPVSKLSPRASDYLCKHFARWPFCKIRGFQRTGYRVTRALSVSKPERYGFGVLHLGELLVLSGVPVATAFHPMKWLPLVPTVQVAVGIATIWTVDRSVGKLETQLPKELYSHSGYLPLSITPLKQTSLTQVLRWGLIPKKDAGRDYALLKAKVEAESNLSLKSAGLQKTLQTLESLTYHAQGWDQATQTKPVAAGTQAWRQSRYIGQSAFGQLYSDLSNQQPLPFDVGSQ